MVFRFNASTFFEKMRTIFNLFHVFWMEKVFLVEFHPAFIKHMEPDMQVQVSVKIFSSQVFKVGAYFLSFSTVLDWNKEVTIVKR